MSSPGLGARISLFDLVRSERKQGRAAKDTRGAGRLSGHVAGERLGIKDRPGATAQRGQEEPVGLNWVTAARRRCGRRQSYFMSFPSDWNGLQRNRDGAIRHLVVPLIYTLTPTLCEVFTKTTCLLKLPFHKIFI